MKDSFPQDFEIQDMEKEIFSELEELELASQLLEVSNDEELDSFLSNLIKKVSNISGKVINSDTGRALGNILKATAKRALPVIGKGIGSYLGGSKGAKWGKRIGESAGVLFGLELEGLSPEDQEFEVARRFVKLAGRTIAKTSSFSPSLSAAERVRKAFTESAKKYAPGLLKGDDTPRGDTSPLLPVDNNGKWIRNGKKIIIINC